MLLFLKIKEKHDHTFQRNNCLGLVSDGWIRNRLLCWLEKWQRKHILWVYEIATVWLPCWDWHGTGYMFSLWRSLLWIALVTYARLCLKIMKDVVCCCLFCSVLTHQYLLTRLETVTSLTKVYCQLCCRTVFLEPDFKAAWMWVVGKPGGETCSAFPCFL